MLKDSLLTDQKELWWKMADADQVVNLFDTSTWDDADYEPLVCLIHQKVVPHALHQQRCENHVQMAAYTASTNVREGRRTDRANALSYIVRAFNREAVIEVTSSRGKKVSRVEGRDRVRLYAKHCDKFNRKAERARASIGQENYRQLVTFIEDATNKMSHVDLEARKTKYSSGIDKPRKVTKSERNNCGIDVPAEMDGGLKIKDIQRKYDKEIKAEIACRRIELPEDENGNKKTYTQLSMKEIRDLLKVDQMKMLTGELKAGDGIRPSDVKYIVPQSAAMQALVATINSS